jgi:hypothetical protein
MEPLKQVKARLGSLSLTALHDVTGTTRGYRVRADAESLAEAGIMLFLAKLQPLLSLLGVRCEVKWRKMGTRMEIDASGQQVEVPIPYDLASFAIARAAGQPPVPVHETTGDGYGQYVLWMAEVPAVIYDADVLAAENGDSGQTPAWTRATAYLVSFLDRMLVAHAIGMRAFALLPGTNDTSIVIADASLAGSGSDGEPPWQSADQLVFEPIPYRTDDVGEGTEDA